MSYFQHSYDKSLALESKRRFDETKRLKGLAEVILGLV